MPDTGETKKFAELLEKISSGSYSSPILELSEQGISDDQAKELALALASNKHIKTIYLSNNAIKKGGAEALSAIPFELEELVLSNNQIPPEGAEFLAKGPRVHFLDLSGNPLGPTGVEHFSESSNIKEISLNECEAGDTGAKAILRNDHFQGVNLSGNGITDKGVEKISGKSLIDLDLSQNRITSTGAALIAKHKSLVILNLSMNRVTYKGFADICTSSGLQRIELSNNQICFDKNISFSLPSDSSLKSVGLSGNEISGICTKLLEALASIPKLEILDLASNHIDDAGANILYQHKSRSLKEIDLTGNPIRDLSLIKKGKKVV